MIQNKTLGIFVRIPLYVLGEALRAHLAGTPLDEDTLTQMLATDYSGWKTKKFAREHINSAVLNSPISTFMEAHDNEILQALDNNSDRPLILTAVICARFHFAYQVATIFARQFRQQDIVSTEVIKRRVADIYGMNRSTENTLNSVIPQLIEAGLVRRPRPGIYEPTALIVPSHAITTELWKEAFFANEPLSNREQPVEDLMFEPFFRFLNPATR
ncbi:MAG: hypothetical protein IJU62_06830 [Muribaculaceae bacterium]|nr:hypothetical protein [Muribaculaceae bacterium]